MVFKDKHVIVTGASGALGRAIALSFAEKGAIVGIGYNKSEKGANETLKIINEKGGKAQLLKFDVSDTAQVEAVFSSFLKEHGTVDILINNAGLVDDKPFALMSPDSWSSVIDSNLKGVFNCSRAVVRPMMAKKSGVIINIGSVAGIRSSPGQTNYSASKGGILAFTRTLASELAPSGIRVNAVVPGLLTEGMAARLDHRISNEYKERIPLTRFGSTGEVSHAVLFLASEEASYIIGQALVVDGGLTL